MNGVASASPTNYIEKEVAVQFYIDSIIDKFDFLKRRRNQIF
jgi:hypothetical protein